MANQRMYIQCTECLDHFGIAKRYGDAWYNNTPYTDREGIAYIKAMNAWFELHFGCYRNPDIDDRSGDAPSEPLWERFKIEYED